MAEQSASPPRHPGGATPPKKAGNWMGKWGQIVLSGLGGAVLTLVSIVLAFASVRDTADANAAAIKELGPMVHELQITRAADDAATVERWRNLNRRLDKFDTYLERGAK